MLEFKTIQILKPNTEILEIIKSYKYKIKNVNTPPWNRHLDRLCQTL